MSNLRGASATTVYALGDPSVQALVLKVYRCAMAGFTCADAGCWEAGWKALSEVGPPEETGPLFGQFYGFARALLNAAQRPLCARPASCSALCADERLALCMIDTAQRADFEGTLAAASHLLGDALEAAQALGAALARRGLRIGAPEQNGERGTFNSMAH